MSNKRIETIEVQNLKAVAHQALNLHGCSCIVTAGNRMGKTTLLRGIIDRIQGVKPDVVVRKNEHKGFCELTLNTGERIRWDFSADGKERLTLTTTEGIRTGLTREIANRYFPASFDIDRFLQSSPKDRVKQLQTLLGIDLTDINSLYKEAYDERTIRNRIVAESKGKVVPMTNDLDLYLNLEAASTKELQDELALVGKHNAEFEKAEALITTLKGEIVALGEAFRKKDADIVKINETKEADIKEIDDEISRLKEKRVQVAKKAKEGVQEKEQEKEKVRSEIEAKSNRLKAGEEWVKVEKNRPKSVEEIKTRIAEVEQKNSLIEKATKAHQTQLAYNEALEYWKEADDEVKRIEQERVEMLQCTKMPEGITIEGDNIIVDGLPLDRLQQSTSELYIVALKLAALKLGEVGALHFDAATLDRPNLEKVMEWAESNGLQLLIERPDFEGGEIEYQLVNQPQTE